MQSQNACGCCEGLSVEVPVQVYNRPGLKAITYRVGTHAQFKESLLAQLTISRLRALRELTTRNNDDFTIAVLDAWATVADVLTFYQERIANELYLDTATEEFSIVQLARLIGYQLRPGVAAGTCLAFTLDENTTGPLTNPDSGNNSKPTPPPLTIEAGIKVQSVPGPGEEAQLFETVEKIEARAEWNSIRPVLTQTPHSIDASKIIVVTGANNDLKTGDVVLILKQGRTDNALLKRVLNVIPNDESKTTSLFLDTAATQPSFILPALTVTGNIAAYSAKVPLSSEVVDDIISKTWRSEELAVLINTQGWPEDELKKSIEKKLARPPAVDDSIFVFRKRTAVFGHNALKQPGYTNGVPDLPSAWTDWPLNEVEGKIHLDAVYEQVLPGSYIAIQRSSDALDGITTVFQGTEVDHRPRTEYGISAKSTVITIPADDPWWDTDLNDLAAIRGVIVYAQSVPLTLAASSVNDEVSGDLIMLDRLYSGLKQGQKIILSGDRTDLIGTQASELRTLKEILVVKGITVIKFDKPLSWKYVRGSVKINANVAAATHGETVKEILGSGDATRSFQQFTLKQLPLTFVSATTPSGISSTLEIRVNDLLWKEVPSLYDHGPNDHIYITRQDDQQRTTVIFGDGKNGARLPSGPDNIKATYRKGIGVSGLLKPDKLSQLLTRPLGIKGVTNSISATGAADPERLEHARQNATLTIFTLGRIVSLKDYEDFARAFAGISKAIATWVWTGQKRSVHLTVAGYDGATIDPAGALYENLSAAIAASGIPEVLVIIESYQPRFFCVTAGILVHPDYLPELVLALVKQKLQEQFSFEQRNFGQPVVYSEVIAVMQQVEGVTAVDIDDWYRLDQAPNGPEKARIDAKTTRSGSDNPFAAELLTIDPNSINLHLML
ncbi:MULTISPECIES: putative baseplate assembly protein [Niastella]|uniref:Baseplate assembly protein n=1 Tax=Niastella soli TaxID=2821487 RepID=A0ABS3Z5Q4_9BACT|nr:putative baseplate assembly protein [Niastella soli]MBO9205505.1 putative baseplate assembly protein [Niastella soli]